MFLQITRCRVSDFLIVAIVAETNVGAEGAGLVMLARYAKVNAYKGWPILDTLPEGWKIDKKTGSPVAGCEFITDGKSPLYGQKRALLRVRQPQAEMFAGDATRIEFKTEESGTSTRRNKPWQHFDAPCARTVNELAREKFKQRLLNDILCDLMICEIEGWCKLEYINQMKELICSMAQSVCIDA